MQDDVKAAGRTEARPFRDIAEIAEAENAAEANTKLAEGWELLGIYQIVRPVRRPDGQTLTRRGVLYVLGKPGERASG